MLQVYTNRKIHFKTVETATATLVVAVLVETYGNETRVSEPKIIKVINKNQLKLAGNVSSIPRLVAAQNKSSIKRPVVSPFQYLFSNKHSNNVTWLFARPPTK